MLGIIEKNKTKPLGKIWSSNSALAHEVLSEIQQAYQSGQGWHQLSNDDLRPSHIGKSTVLTMVQKSKVVKK